jgi:hypothetical protein
MQALRIDDHSLAGWSSYAQKFGFVPDPMIFAPAKSFSTEPADQRNWSARTRRFGTHSRKTSAV